MGMMENTQVNLKLTKRNVVELIEIRSNWFVKNKLGLQSSLIPAGECCPGTSTWSLPGWMLTSEFYPVNSIQWILLSGRSRKRESLSVTGISWNSIPSDD